MRDIVLSYSSISAYKACNWEYMLRYVMGWRPEEDKDFFRIGGNWAKLQEIMSYKPHDLCPVCAAVNRSVDPDCYLCEGGGTVPDDPATAGARYLEYVYSDMPEHFDAHRWETEKLTILYAFTGYRWLYPENEYEVIAGEIPFSLPIIDPVTNRKLPRCRLGGMIDQLWRHKESGRIVIGEQKSTGSSLGDGGYWDTLKMSGQVQTYSYAMWLLWTGGALKQYGLNPSEAQIVTPVYDVWMKPNIKPKKLSQSDSKKLVETGEYCGKNFAVIQGEGNWVHVNGVQATTEPLKKEGTFAIQETPEMYAERLLLDITERPDFYFGRKEIPVDENDLAEFAVDCSKLVQTIRYIEKENLWIRNGKSCKNPGKCDFYKACHENRRFNLSTEEAPEGYKTTLDAESLEKKQLEEM